MSEAEQAKPAAAEPAAELTEFSRPAHPVPEQEGAPAPQPETPAGACGNALNAEPDYDSGEWEYKPAVKYTAAGLLVLAALALCYSFYWLGHRQGFAAGVESDLVAEKLNAAAASNLTRLMQLTAADDAELQSLAAAPERGLAWIKDPAIRREAEWQLTDVLLKRGLADSAGALAEKLMADVAQADARWARRAAEVGEAFMGARRPHEAAPWFRRAADAFAGARCPAESIAALQQYFAAVCADSNAPQEKELAALLRTVPDGVSARSLRTAINLQLALIHRNRGDRKAAAEALAALEGELLPGGSAAADLTPFEHISAGMALAERGQYAQALAMMEQGEAALSHEGGDAYCRPEALRSMASATMQLSGDVNAALALLNRAEGVAECLLPAEHDFWACLAEQRGWLLLLSQDEESALASFRRAAEAPRDRTVALQAMEGAGRCLLVLNRAEEAGLMLERCAELRRRQLPADAGGFGRVCLLLAQSQEHRGQAGPAAESYGTAARLLAQAGEPEAQNYLTALLGQGYVLVQLKQWAQGQKVWEAVTPLVKDVPDRREEARRMLNECRRHNHLPSVAVPPHDAQATAEAAAADAAAEGEAEDEEAAAETLSR